jgi:hypothetical protein
MNENTEDRIGKEMKKEIKKPSLKILEGQDMLLQHISFFTLRTSLMICQMHTTRELNETKQTAKTHYSVAMLPTCNS